ncbi:HAMP domain-containing histidine kinase [Bacillus sp. BRMEA1]|nr:HAMP domain-containing histidine kinase [Neobacillus endophyticus]
MKEFYSQMSRKSYYISMLIVIFLMVTGVITGKSLFYQFEIGFILQCLLILVLSVCLLIYPKYETHFFRIMIILLGSIYFYLLFFLYPETWSTYIYICFIPALAILFFDSKLFYFSFVLNGILQIFTMVYTTFFDKGSVYASLKGDLIGNTIDLVGVQVIIFLIYYLSFNRIKKQHLYYEQLQNSERLKLTGQLTAAVAHEIRNPLTVVKGFLQFYKEDTSIPPSMKDNFCLMIDELETAEEVISQFLSLAKPDKDLSLEKVDVEDVLHSVTSLLHSYGTINDNQIHINAEEACYIAINKIEFKQLIINLIKNAIEASEVGQSIVVDASRKGKYIEIKIKDEGSGMSIEEIKSLGTPFYSLKSKGTGLGLMICFNIVEKYDGALHFNSSIGKGTTVTARFLAVND